MSLDRAKAHLEQFGLADRIQLFDVSSATVELAAQAVGCAPAHIAKTLSFPRSSQPFPGFRENYRTAGAQRKRKDDALKAA